MGLSISWIVREESRGIGLEVNNPRLRDVRRASRRLFVNRIDCFRALIVWDRCRPARERRSETTSRSRISNRSNVPVIWLAGEADLVMESTRRSGTVVMLRFCLRSWSRAAIDRGGGGDLLGSLSDEGQLEARQLHLHGCCSAIP